MLLPFEIAGDLQWIGPIKNKFIHDDWSNMIRFTHSAARMTIAFISNPSLRP